ncbi:MAG: universal stress protein [Burkholderiales bacterium RIFCSPLOWO2_02_FULL_57_36]|nr:MAG: universal stress protein [Burkholderiales bacterium RIFCSPLOWO2_02_FULL_57_36]
MFRTILVPTDGSTLSDKAITAALEFAKFTGAKVVGLSVAQPDLYGPLSESAVATANEQKSYAMAQSNVDKIAGIASSLGVPCQTTVMKSFSPAEEIINTAKRFNCDVIFMASHGRTGLSKLMIGSETQKVLTGSTLPVMVFR